MAGANMLARINRSKKLWTRNRRKTSSSLAIAFFMSLTLTLSIYQIFHSFQNASIASNPKLQSHSDLLDSMIPTTNSNVYSPLNCQQLLSDSQSESRLILEKHPMLRSAEYEPKEAKNTTPVFQLTNSDITDILGNVLDPNLGTKLIRASNNQTLPHFYISLHRPEIDSVRWGMFSSGEYYEKENTKNFLEILNLATSAHNGTYGGIIFDVGMNIGWFSLLGAAYGLDVISFDPNPLHHVRMCQALLANGWYADPTFEHVKGKPKVDRYMYGVGEKPGKLPLSFDIRSTGSASYTGDKKDAVYRRETDVLTLDSFAQSRGWISPDGKPLSDVSDKNSFHIAIMKVDVEGFEDSVFAGSTQILRTGLVKNIFTEFTLLASYYPNMTVSRNRVFRCVSILSRTGYKLLYIGDWSGGFATFRAGKNSTFPTNSTMPGYVDMLTNWIYDFAYYQRKWKQVNLLWIQNEAKLGGIFTGL